MDPYQFIDGLNKFGSKDGYKPGLKRVKALLSHFGNPEENLRVIHVGGSNGKGSTVAFLKSVYQQAGYRVGVYTSPHLLAFNERMVVNDRMISTAELTELTAELAPLVEEISTDPVLGKPTYFEVVTAMALIFFSRQKVDLLLLEVGLGGRLDATNVVPAPLASVITSISLEHTAILGETTAEIAREKAGIIKEGCPVVTAVRDQSALQQIKQAAVEKKADLTIIDEVFSFQREDFSLKGQEILVSNSKVLRRFKIGLLGEHQVRNAVLAVAVIDLLQKKIAVGEKELQEGLVNAYWPGRMEVVAEKPLIIIDGAHNSEGIEMLVQFLGNIVPAEKKLTVILGILNDKNIKEIIRLLNFRDKNYSILISRNKDSRSQAPETIKEIAAQEGLKGIIYPTLEEAINSSLTKAGPEDVICITGSLYTVAEAKIILKSFISLE